MADSTDRREKSLDLKGTQEEYDEAFPDGPFPSSKLRERNTGKKPGQGEQEGVQSQRIVPQPG